MSIGALYQRRWFVRTQLSLFSLRLLLLMAAIVLGNSCSWLSETTLIQSVPSPDGMLLADLYQVGGGGAIGNVADYVSLRPANQPFRKTRNYVFGGLDGTSITLRWTSRRELEVGYTTEEHVGRASPSWRDVTIKYVVHDVGP
jgi:hypothetical protein